jgi:hypothetical protein
MESAVTRLKAYATADHTSVIFLTADLFPCAHLRGTVVEVAYLLLADNVSRLLPCVDRRIIFRVVFQKWRWSLSYCPSKGIAVHKQAKDDVVHLYRF